MEATPRPWKIDKEGRDYLHIINDNDFVAIASIYCDPIDENAQANAELIVKAVNNYDRLVQALDNAVELLKLPHMPSFTQIKQFESLLKELKP